MGKSRWLTLVGLVLFCVVVILPPLIYNYVYPSLGDDTAAHLAIFDKISAGAYDSGKPLILSYRMVGYPIVWVSDVIGVSTDTLFLWFSYTALAGIGLTLYYVFSKLSGRKAGWFSLVVVLFGAQGILFQFYYGQIFNAINIGIILPLLLLFSVQYLVNGKVYQMLLAIGFGLLFGAFHTSGIYLPAFAGFSLMMYVVYKLVRRQNISRRVVTFGIAMVVLPIGAFLLSVTNSGELWTASMRGFANMGRVPVSPYLMDIVSPTVLVLLAFILVFGKDILKNMDKETKVLCVLLGGAVVVLAVSAFVPLSLDPYRQALDLATIIAMLVAVMVAMFKWSAKNRAVSLVIILAVGFGLWHNLPTWFGYNSAISKADKDAIAYINATDVKEYNTSPEVAYWIYDRFTNAKYSENASSFLVVRNVPMTPMSDVGNKWYDGHGIRPNSGDLVTGWYNDGGVTVEVYKQVSSSPCLPVRLQDELR